MMVYATPEVEAKVDKLCLEMVTLAAKGWSVDQLYYYALKHSADEGNRNGIIGRF